jgi:predicted dehydrogenase
MDRRHFAHLSALALASMQVRGSGQATDKATSAIGRVGIAAVGLGSIAEVFMHAVTASSNARITGLVTGHPAE